MLRLQASIITLDAAKGEETAPTIMGIAVPWDTTAVVMSGEKVAFQRGAFDVNQKPAKLVEGHDLNALVGVVPLLSDEADGLHFMAQFARTARANDAVELVKATAYDAVSVGAEVVESTFDTKTKTTIVTKAHLVELSLVAVPAYKGAQITSIAASEPESETEPTETNSEEEINVEQEPTIAEASVPTAPIVHASAKREFRLPSPAEYISAFVRGGSDFAQLNENIRAAAPDVVTNDLPGVLPTPVISSIYNNFRGLRPIIDSVGPRAMPQAGKVFIRPVVTTHTTIGAATEGLTIDDGTFVVDDVQFTKSIFGGYVNVSEASIDWSSPEILSGLLDDMGRIYANQTDDYACGVLEAGVTNTNNFTAANIADPVEWVTWFYTAASDILVASNGNLPSTVYMAPNRWASAGALSDTADRPLFPQVGPMNAFGTGAGVSDSMMNMFGCRVVVDRNLTSGMLILGDPSGMEYYEQQKGAVSLEQPSQLSRQIAFRGYASAQVIDSTKFIKAAFV